MCGSRCVRTLFFPASFTSSQTSRNASHRSVGLDGAPTLRSTSFGSDTRSADVAQRRIHHLPPPLTSPCRSLLHTLAMSIPLSLWAFLALGISARAAPSSSDDASDLVSVAWYTGWHAEDYPPSNVSWSKYSLLHYAFACVISSSTLGLHSITAV